MIRSIAAATLFVFLLIPLEARPLKTDAGPETGPRYAPGEMLVKYRDHVPAGIRTMHNAEAGARAVREYKKIGVFRLRLPAGVGVEEAVERYRANPDVEYAEPNFVVSVDTLPDDPDFGELWGLDNAGQPVDGISGTSDADIDAPEAWDISVGSSGVVVAVIDTGVDHLHPDLAENIWRNPDEIPGNGIDDDSNGYVDDSVGWDFANGDNNPMDDLGHGTHVAGTIGAVGNDGTGITGVNWKAGIMALKFLDSGGYGNISDAIDAILYASSEGAQVINCSWGGGGYSQSLKDAIDASNAIIVCSAGNDGWNTDYYLHYPSGYDSPNVLSVAASDQNDALPWFSNYGISTVDLAAPGSNIYSTINGLRSQRFSDGFDDADISDWSSDGTWTLSGAVFDTPGYSLSDSEPGAYAPGSESIINAPAIDLSGRTGCSLYYRLRLETEEGADFLYAEAALDQTNGPWTVLSERSGSTGGSFGTFVDPLSGFDGASPLYIRFRLSSDSQNNEDGAHIDDVRVMCLIGSEYGYKAGTSMAAPHASGAAMLLRAHYPVLSALDVKAALLSSVDPKPQFAGKLLSEGRLNAASALSGGLRPAAPAKLSASATSVSSISVSWRDNSNIETGFELERKEGGGAFALLVALGADATSYADSGLVPSTAYAYRVRAVGSNGASSYSLEAGATTPPPPTEDGGGGGGGGGCFIATAAYGDSSAPEVLALRRFRDEHLLTNPAGRAAVGLYYRLSPPLAGVVSGNPALVLAVRAALYPVVFSIARPWASASFALLALAGAVLVVNRRRKERRRAGV